MTQNPPKVEAVGQGVGTMFRTSEKHPAPEVPEHADPFTEPLRNVAPRRSRMESHRTNRTSAINEL
ncbi:MAG: hypothetical protein OXC68_01290 [Aestuariivita sp.]|nr:hypothetical protein [Aestuariivita sp.]